MNYMYAILRPRFVAVWCRSSNKFKDLQATCEGARYCSGDAPARASPLLGNAMHKSVIKNHKCALDLRAFSSFDDSPLAAADQLSSKSIDAVVNKQNVQDSLYTYIVNHTRESSILKQLREETLVEFPQAAKMAVSPEQGAFLAWLVGTMAAQTVIELGVFTGYSSVAIARALPDHGKLIACDRDPKTMAMAEKYWALAGVDHKVDCRLGPAIETLQAMIDDPTQHGMYDFAFIDADKRKYKEYFELLLTLIRTGGVIAIDNVLWYGKVADTNVADKATIALRELNDFLVDDPRVDVSLVPIGDGIMLCRKT